MICLHRDGAMILFSGRIASAPIPQLRMDQDTCVHIPEIKTFSHSCCKHYRKLQSLTLVDRHDLYRTFPGSGKIYLPVIHLILLELLDISYKLKDLDSLSSHIPLLFPQACSGLSFLCSPFGIAFAWSPYPVRASTSRIS